MTRQPIALVSLVMAVSLAAACQWAPAADDDGLTVVAFGDSTTAARGALPVYADILSRELTVSGRPVRVINAGVGGNQTDQARARFDHDVLSHKPAAVIIQFGINDAAVDVWRDPPATEPRVSLPAYEQNLRHFIEVLSRQQVDVVLMTPNPLRWTPQTRVQYGRPPYQPDEVQGFNVKLREYAKAVRRLAKSTGKPLVDVDQIFEQYGRKEGQAVEDLLLDGLHPNERGHRLVADELLAVLSKRDEPDSSPQSAHTTTEEECGADHKQDREASRTHASQWQQAGQATLLTDMTRFTPTAALSSRREHAKWKIFEYETADFTGQCLSVGRESSAPDLTLKLDKRGWHAVYVGLSTITNLVRAEKNQLEVKLTVDPAYTRLSNRQELAAPRRDVLEEVFLEAADLTGNDLHISTVHAMPARIHYVKLIPLTDAEVAAIQADRRQTATRTSVATFDGFTWIHPFRPQNRADLAATFSPYRDSDFKTWWFQVGGADLVHHPTQVGNLMGGDLDTFPRAADREYVESVRHLHAQGVDPLRVAIEEAHAQQAEILICLRAAGWKAAPPWEEFFMSEFYEAHPEWRCVDYDGTPTMHLSYAVEEVQDHLIEVYREVLQRRPDGVGFLFHRGLPLMLWEEPFRRRFMEAYTDDPRTLPEDDVRVHRMRAEIMTGFLRKIRRLLDETAQASPNPDRRLKLAVTTFSTPEDNERFGLDVETWIREGLIDQIGIAWFAYFTSGMKTRSGDTAYYARIAEGTDVQVYPFHIGWKMSSAAKLLSTVAQDYRDGADGIAIWDPSQFAHWESGNNPYWPLVSKLGHRDEMRNGALLYETVPIPLSRLGENHYSRWYPNTGF
ncbi:MAG: GDSL-type esterase/lipase family protein [Planctomycetaceae bacterium]